MVSSTISVHLSHVSWLADCCAEDADCVLLSDVTISRVVTFQAEEAGKQQITGGGLKVPPRARPQAGGVRVACFGPANDSRLSRQFEG